MRTATRTVVEYIASSPPNVRAILRKLRSTVRAAVPAATETIIYRMPAYRLHGDVMYFAAFKQHIGVFPPVRGPAALLKAVKPYAGPKGNLRFPLAKPIPYGLIGRIARARAKYNRRRAAEQASQPPRGIRHVA